MATGVAIQCQISLSLYNLKNLDLYDQGIYCISVSVLCGKHVGDVVSYRSNITSCMYGGDGDDYI